MDRNRMLLALALALAVGLGASIFVYRQMQRAGEPQPQTLATRQVVVAAIPLALGTRLQPQQLKTVSWPADQPIAGMFENVNEAVNRALLTNVIENEPILEGKLASLAAGAGLPSTIPEGMRALSVSVNDVVAVAGFVTPGTMVDVLVTGSLDGSNTGTQAITKTILENIKVLAAGQKIEQDAEGKPQTVPVITLLVTPDQASVLTMASTEGKIQLALRNTIDTKKAEPAPVLRTTLFAGAAPPRPAVPATPRVGRQEAPTPPPAPAVKPKFVVEVIHGDKRESKSFDLP